MGIQRLHEAYEERKQQRAAAFLGRCYWYNTPADGRKRIGVTPALGGDIYIVGYFRDSGALRAVKSPHLRASAISDRLQASLDQWAKQRGLEVAA
jgi:hypothetical protein